MEGLERGADAYLTKPFDERELILRIQNLVEQRNNLRELYLQKSGLSTSNEHFPISNPSDKMEVENVFLEKIQTVLESQLDNPNFSMVDLGKAIGLSQTQLNRKLLALTGLPPVKLMRSMRLKKAKELLISTSLTISEVAYQVGFTDPGYFSKTFKSEMKISPKEYRQNMR